jgi:hypothetical protein
MMSDEKSVERIARQHGIEVATIIAALEQAVLEAARARLGFEHNLEARYEAEVDCVQLWHVVDVVEARSADRPARGQATLAELAAKGLAGAFDVGDQMMDQVFAAWLGLYALAIQVGLARWNEEIGIEIGDHAALDEIRRMVLPGFPRTVTVGPADR